MGLHEQTSHVCTSVHRYACTYVCMRARNMCIFKYLAKAVTDLQMLHRRLKVSLWEDIVQYRMTTLAKSLRLVE